VCAYCGSTSKSWAIKELRHFDESEQIAAIKKILSHISARGEKTDPAAILGLLSKFRNGGQRAEVFADESLRAMAQHVQTHYESALRACNAVDFDDLILLTLRLFTEHPAALEACRQKYQYVLVDEYQDTMRHSSNSSRP
jgi:superfamily I DNA/RNA helicase